MCARLASVGMFFRGPSDVCVVWAPVKKAQAPVDIYTDLFVYFHYVWHMNLLCFGFIFVSILRIRMKEKSGNENINNRQTVYNP